MSTRAKLTLAGSILFTVGIVYGVHHMQQSEREAMRAGLALEEEKYQRKQKNTQELQEQQQLRAYLEQGQEVKSKS
ncbi:hypothetical protein BJ684DRAFT_21961 [Piptocephalis cylindrospora]|uniref:Cytochrome c oxidase assembly protein n=1 Tax=Piptocephalis cylindrospora TaxID=1907219 RepID=A0A4P9XYG2_9FUNG|nr:hypothetical protein BJ684DRAFT_21961 [Piptocephalis cylindrospora]|eukprot:RKP11468.1 hypothetical protein BJ684DRAFT_21961 [Piptocephalis cylindrospora]